MELSREESEALDTKRKELISLYFRVKRYIIASEKVTQGGRLSIPAINELRNAFDHEMRAQMALSDGKAPSDAGMPLADYCISNISKAIGHVYRAGYDALDALSLGLVTDINKIIESVSRTTLVMVIADYSERVRAPLEEAIKVCDDAKAGKDVEVEGSLKLHFARYEEAIEKLNVVRECLYKRLRELADVEAEQKSNVKKQRNWAIVAIAVGMIGTVAVAYIFKSPTTATLESSATATVDESTVP